MTDSSDLDPFDESTDCEFVPAEVVAVSANLPPQFDSTPLIREAVCAFLRAERLLTISYIR